MCLTIFRRKKTPEGFWRTEAQAERNYQEQQKRRNAENAALNRMNENGSWTDISGKSRLMPCSTPTRPSGMRRYSAKMNVTKKPLRKIHGQPVMTRPPGYCCSTVSSRHRWKADCCCQTVSRHCHERMTEAHKQLLALQQRISDLTGKSTADEKSVLARKNELIPGADAAGM